MSPSDELARNAAIGGGQLKLFVWEGGRATWRSRKAKGVARILNLVFYTFPSYHSRFAPTSVAQQTASLVVDGSSNHVFKLENCRRIKGALLFIHQVL